MFVTTLTPIWRALLGSRVRNIRAVLPDREKGEKVAVMEVR